MTQVAEVVGYDRRTLGVGIVHIGVGNFHRSHQARYLDRLAREDLAAGWGICGVGMLPSDLPTLEALRSQGGEYTLVEQDPSGPRRALRIGSLVECLHVPEDLDAVLDRLADPGTRIVSLTITEGGYNVSDATGEFDLSADDVRADLAPGAVPRTVFGLVTAGLARRRELGIEPFTVLCCDNIEENGEVARRSFCAFARAADPALADWMEDAVRFPSTMVDRITPATTPALRDLVREEFGIEDAAPVLAESYLQWVIEDDFGAGRPAWDQVGAQLVGDVRPYETLKLRLLNGSHQAMAYFGLLAGLDLAHEAVLDPVIAHALDRYLDEAEQTLAPVPGVDVAAYRRSLLERFGNVYLPDTLARLAVDGSDRVAKFVVPVIRDLRAQGRPSPCSAAIVAGWARYAELALAEGSRLPYTDRQRSLVEAGVRRMALAPADFLLEPHWFGELGDDSLLRDEFTRAYEDLVRSSPGG